ncbi:MAG: hypothetical protein L6R37_006026 [Teloschistes peruensis]|nr:MAG: hypothetical protein L6R37_006026 [Teloschistes peruensis]
MAQVFVTDDVYSIPMKHPPDHLFGNYDAFNQLKETRTHYPPTILTLSPSCPHAVVPTILALDRLLKYISSQQAHTVQPLTPTAKDGEKPFSCGTFTLIAGTGFSGACLALFLGRFRMTLSGAMTQWYHLIRGIDPDPQRIFLFAGTSGGGLESSRHVFFEADEETMCRHVVVAAAEQDSKKKKKKKEKKEKKKKDKKKEQESAEYNFFRTYDLPGSREAMSGVADPWPTKISLVLDTIAAAEPYTNFKDSASPFPFQMSSGDKAKRGACRIVEVALEEVWALYGKDVPIAAIVDVGDGFEEWEEGADAREIAKCLVAAGERAERPVAAAISGDEVGDGNGEGEKVGGEKDTVQKDGEAPSTKVNGERDGRLVAKANGERAERPAAPIAEDNAGHGNGQARKVSGGKDTVQKDGKAPSTKVNVEDKVQKYVEARLREIYGDSAPPCYRLKGRSDTARSEGSGTRSGTTLPQ